MLAAAIFATVLVIWLLSKMRKPAKFPPGPPKLPFVGSVPFIFGSSPGPESRGSLFHGVRKLVAQYGKVAGYHVGDDKFVVVSDYDDIKELMKRDEASGRPPLSPYTDYRLGAHHPGVDGRTMGIILSQGPIWKESRRFTARHLRDFGFGKSSMESILHAQIEKLAALLDEMSGSGNAFSLSRIMNISIVNSLWVIVVGEELELHNPKLDRIVWLINEFATSINFQHPLGFILPSKKLMTLPILRDICKVSHFAETVKAVQDLVKESIDLRLSERKAAGIGVTSANDFLDVLVSHLQKVDDPTSPFYRDKGVDNAVNILVDLFMAGMETTSSTLIWSMLLMIHFPKIQERVHKEIIKVVGSDRLPSLSDQDKLPFTNAVMLEILRYAPLVPYSVPHYSTEDITLKGGYVIPANSTILPNLFYVMRDPDYWRDPETFNPDRFLDDAGNFVRDERIVPFGIGKRFCLGQSLAEKEYFLFFSAIMQKFKVTNFPGKALPSISVDDQKVGAFILSPPHFEVLLERRMACSG